MFNTFRWTHFLKSHKTSLIIFTISLGLFLALMLLPETLIFPVKGATGSDWNHHTFWQSPWSQSGVHKGIDIFAPEGTHVIAATYGIVLYSGELGRGGNVVAVLGPKWRIHYYAHLAQITTEFARFVGTTDIIGSVGRSGNAKHKPPHLHYSIVSVFPLIWRWDNSLQGWKKMFFLDPSAKLLRSDERLANPGGRK